MSGSVERDWIWFERENDESFKLYCSLKGNEHNPSITVYPYTFAFSEKLQSGGINIEAGGRTVKIHTSPKGKKIHILIDEKEF